MKLLVDELPNWRGECPFAEQTWAGYVEGHAWTYICKFKDETCNLDEIDNECFMFKVMEHTNES